MQEASFKIYNASAGSGKTYTLAKAYLKIVLSSKNSSRQILAITFTNKAVSEMKRRILDSLFNFSLSEVPRESTSMFAEICDELHVDAGTLRKKSKIVLKEILHNYAFFDVSTIDKFTHRIIRTFARDLRLPQNFEVVLDTALLLDEAVAKLIDKAGEDEELTQVLIDFALEKIEGDRNWDISFDLNKIGKLLFNENYSLHLEKLQFKQIRDFSQLKNEIIGQIKSIEQLIIQKSQNALDIIKEEGFDYSDFPRETLPNHFKKLKEATFDPILLYKNKLEENLVDGKILKVNISPKSTLAPRILEIYLHIKSKVYTRAFLKNVYNNIVPLTLLNAIQNEVKKIQTDRDQLSISEFNTIISNQIKDQPAPFIYERLGEKYRHYFVDEFQDTSQMQWSNLIPLIGNALESEDLQGKRGSLLLVGDAKQAIYRWRGGKAEQFLNLVNEKNNPFVVHPQIESLPRNFRSYEEIVKHNNDFFTVTCPILNNQIYQALFLEGNKQEHNSKPGGYVNYYFIEKEEDFGLEDFYCKEVFKTIQTVLEKNYSLNDMVILVRDNKHGIILADFLTQKGIPVISADSLLIKSSLKVKFLIDLLEYSIHQELETSYDILNYLVRDSGKKHPFIKENLRCLGKFLKLQYDLDLERFKQVSVYDGLEYAIKIFALAEDSDAYVTYFMDVVFEVEQREGTGIQTFLLYWEKKKDNLGITAPENVDALQIMSVHKAKGLEFPIVIFPFANSHIYKEIDPKLWLPIPDGNLEGFTELLISKKQEVADYGSAAKVFYDEEQHKLELDAFNVLYVALTRAEKALFIISEKDLSKNGEHKIEYYSGLFIHYLKQKGLWDGIQSQYTFGNLEMNTNNSVVISQENIVYKYTYKERPEFRILAKSGNLWDTEVGAARVRGNLIHSILGLIETEKDVSKALATLKRNGDLAVEDVADIESKINQIINNEELRDFYKDGSLVLNERDIIANNGSILRPDRIVIREDKATIMDYKTGKRNVRYYDQVLSYAGVLQEMGYKIENKIIIYINETVEPEFI